MKHGIKRRLTSAYSPHQNGRAERANRTLFKTMRCALMDSGMKWKYWVDAYFVGLNARNRYPEQEEERHHLKYFTVIVLNLRQ